MLIVFKLLFIVFSLYNIFGIFQRKKGGSLGLLGALFWSFFWCAVIVVVLWPTTVQMLADTFGIGRGSDFVLYISVALLFFLLFRLHIKIENMNKNITKIVRRDSLQEKS